MADVTIRQARHDDAAGVAEFTADIWADRGGDYMERAFPKWVDEDDERRRTFVAEADDRVAGVCRGAMLSDYEGWAEGMRVAADYRGHGVARALNERIFEWAVERGATVVRNMVFGWNGPGLGTSRSVGFRAVTECRWAWPTPDATATVDGYEVVADPDAAWSHWQASDARDHLDGLALDFDESWALASLTRERCGRAAADDGLLALRDDDGTHAMAARMHEYERDGGDSATDDDGEPTRWAEYGVAAWSDLDAASALFAAIARDAGRRDRDRTRVLIPETPRHVSDVAALGVQLRDDPVFVTAADVSSRR